MKRDKTSALVRFARDAARAFRPLFALLMALAFLLSGSSVWSANIAGVVTELEGTAIVKRAGDNLDAYQGMGLIVADEIDTSADGHLTIMLADKTKLELAAASTLVLDELVLSGKTRESARLTLVTGRIRSIVSSAMHGAGNFTVQTPNVLAGVRGTDFEVEYIEGEPSPELAACLQFSEALVYEGEVEVANSASGSDTVVVKKGFGTTVACDYPPTAPLRLEIFHHRRHEREHRRGDHEDHHMGDHKKEDHGDEHHTEEHHSEEHHEHYHSGGGGGGGGGHHR
jgi:hypothetical protein